MGAGTATTTWGFFGGAWGSVALSFFQLESGTTAAASLRFFVVVVTVDATSVILIGVIFVMETATRWETDRVASFTAAFFGVGGLFAGMSKTTPYLQVFGLCYAASMLMAVKQIRGNVGEFEEVNKPHGYFHAAAVAALATPVLFIELKRMPDRKFIPAIALLVNTCSGAYHTYWWKQLKQ